MRLLFRNEKKILTTFFFLQLFQNKRRTAYETERKKIN